MYVLFVSAFNMFSALDYYIFLYYEQGCGSGWILHESVSDHSEKTDLDPSFFQIPDTNLNKGKNPGSHRHRHMRT